MNKSTQLLGTLAISTILLIFAGNAANNSKALDKGELDICNLKTGDRGSIVGIVTATRRDGGDYYATVVGRQNCMVQTIGTRFNNGILGDINAKVEVSGRVSNSGFFTVDRVKERLDILDLSGTATPVETRIITLDKSDIKFIKRQTHRSQRGAGISYQNDKDVWFPKKLVRELRKPGQYSITQYKGSNETVISVKKVN